MDGLGEYLMEYAVRLSISLLERAWDAIMANIWLAAALSGFVTFILILLGTHGGVRGPTHQAQVVRVMRLAALQSLRLVTLLLTIVSSVDAYAFCHHILNHGEMMKDTTGRAHGRSEVVHPQSKPTCLGIVASPTAENLRCRRPVKRDSCTVESCYCDKHREQGYARLEIWAAAEAGAMGSQ